MTLAFGNANSIVAKLSTNCACAQSLVVSAIPLSIVGLQQLMMERETRFSNRVSHLSLTSKDAT